MIKVMIVDDEQIVREGIQFIINKSFPDVAIVAMAKTGREAIELFEECRPNLIFMDIQMPGINGIDAIRSIRNIDSRVRFVIVSAYEHFDYAKKAVQLGVEDYVLKPINRRRMEEITVKIIQEINEEHAAKKREIETQEKLDKILPVLEHGYIYSIMMNTDYLEEQQNYHQLLGIDPVYAFMMVIEVGEGDNLRDLTNKIGIGIKGNQAYNDIRKIIKYKCKAVVGPMMVNRISVLVYEDATEDEYAQRIRAIELAEAIACRIEVITKSQAYIGVGGCCGLDRMNISYSEAIKALSKITDEKVLHIKDVVNEKNESHTLFKLKLAEEAIVRKVEEGNYEAVEQQMKALFSNLEKTHFGELEVLKRISTELMVLIYAAGYRNNILSTSKVSAGYIDEIAAMTKNYELSHWCLAKALETTLAVQGEKANRVSSVIEEAMHYIDANYNQDLRLKDVAEDVAISPQYFSRIFKLELGVNFIDYLTNVRIEKAKTMLKADEMSIKEICYEIGYNDPNYFSRLFKKTVGVSPTEYVKEL